MLELLQLISFEVGDKCNLSECHCLCPSKVMVREGTPCSNQEFLEFIYYCIEHGFKGDIAFHYYNEPTVQIERCKFLNERIHTLGLKTLMWTNGTYKGDLSMFDKLYVTNYSDNYHFDDRLKIYDMPLMKEYKPCYRPLTIEMPIDYNGNIHMCCGDWANDMQVGNVKQGNFRELLFAWDSVCGGAERGSFDLCYQCQSLQFSPVLEIKTYKVGGKND